MPVTDAAGRANPGGVRLDQVPGKLTAGGFHNFKRADVGRGQKIVQQVKVAGRSGVINFQWDDPFVPGEVTADYNLLVFDASDNYLNEQTNMSIGGIDDNIATGEARELVHLPLNDDGSETAYHLVISRGEGGTGAAKHLRYIFPEDSGVVTGKYLHSAHATIYGHRCPATECRAVRAARLL